MGWMSRQWTGSKIVWTAGPRGRWSCSTKSTCRPVTSSVPLGAILGLILININDLDDEAERTICRFANNTKLGLVADTPQGHAPIQKDFCRLEKWPGRNLIKFYKGTQAPVNAEHGLSGKQHNRKAPGILLDIGLSICQQHALSAKKVSDILRALVPVGQGRGLLPSTPHWGDQTWSAGSSFGLPNRRDRGTLERVQWRPLRWWRDWSTMHMRKGWQNRDCSVQEGEGMEGNLSIFYKFL